MNIEKWWPWYYDIVKAFNFDIEKDRASTQLLSRILKGRSMSLKELRRNLRDRSFIVFGCGPSLECDLKKALNAKLFSRYNPIAADGSAYAIFKLALKSPYAVVTDLDGSIRGLLKADGKGAITVIHAHGDNLEALKRYVPVFKGRITGSTQTEPLDGVYNFGGFTDGDRAVFLLEEVGGSPTCDIDGYGLRFQGWTLLKTSDEA